ncbi:hypothetical protein [Sulfurospirillum sp. MES]|uniref:hypothetical protein n=1 Tax=Sulfurospirillum sp. MES TaxID=1565314 RepID=UPI00054382B3|nr:hypothetical protein [Sulfurospirillum sp. MES]KHG34181.1 MAG: hypothetical protein OA34_07585 [Sulfurospirillum sp. MES]
MKATEQYKQCSKREQKQIQTLFYFLEKKKIKNMNRLFQIAKGLIKEQRAYLQAHSGEFFKKRREEQC